MKTIVLGTSSLQCSRLAYGCWRIAGTWNPAEVTPEGIEQGKLAVTTAYEAGYTLFDHADIYCDGKAEEIFGQVLEQVSGMRDRIVIATKCGIRKAGDPKPESPGRYDFTRDHIIKSCERSLQRLGVETIDLYQLHRPDYLCDPAEVAAAFEELKKAGKVREFGVSNFRPSQVAMLQQACPMPLVVNQVEISLARLKPFEDGTLDQCLERKITPLAWSPLGGGLLADGAKQALAFQLDYHPEGALAALHKIAQDRELNHSHLALAWLLKHPAGIIPIVGSTNPERIKAAVKADELELSLEEWYHLLVAARGEPLP